MAARIEVRRTVVSSAVKQAVRRSRGADSCPQEWPRDGSCFSCWLCYLVGTAVCRSWPPATAVKNQQTVLNKPMVFMVQYSGAEAVREGFNFPNRSAFRLTRLGGLPESMRRGDALQKKY